MTNIKNNNTRCLKTLLINDEYWDFMLYKGEVQSSHDGLDDECLVSFIDAGNEDCIGEDGKLYSSPAYKWENAVSNGLELNNIGITGVDNGLFKYEKDRITNKEFLDIFLSRNGKGTITVQSGDTRFFMSPVNGNTQQYCYDSSIEEDNGIKYLSLRGGFYQGFYKIFGSDYQTLPNAIDSDWHFEFTLRRRSDYNVPDCSINKKYPENSGMFFYIGARAENKFGELYNGVYDIKKESVEDVSDVLEDSYLADESYLQDGDGSYCSIPVEIEDESISGASSEILDGLSESNDGKFEFETDNKFLFFDRTCDGFTTNTWEEGTTVIIEGQAREYKDNAFLLFNRTCTGYTAHDYETDYTKGSGDEKYSMTSDSTSNAFGLKVNEDGSISYRYISCDGETGRGVIEEKTKPGLVNDNEWCTVNVRFRALGGYVDNCGNQHPAKGRKMKMYIYVNGFLIFISKELPIFNFKELNDIAEKQEGVPYNISLGGGSQGLMERIWPDYYDLPTEVYDIERNFAGTFIGDIKSFKMYNCMKDSYSIRSNYKYETSLI